MISYRGHQELTIATVNNANTGKTTCEIKNPQGYWIAIPETTFKLQVDEAPLSIRCENDTQWGAGQVARSFDNNELWKNWTDNGVPNSIQSEIRYLVRGFHFDLHYDNFSTGIKCTIFCNVLDFVNNSQYQYPRYVYIGMNNR